MPTIPPNAAGTRPDPAVSVPIPMSAMPSATATAEPELDPPDTRSGSVACRTAPYGLRTPTSPVANWSRFVLPSTTAPASTRAWTAGALADARPGRPAGSVANDGHAAVVGRPSTSMLSFTASVSPASGSVGAGRDLRVHGARRRERLVERAQGDPDLGSVDLGDPRVREPDPDLGRSGRARPAGARSAVSGTVRIARDARTHRTPGATSGSVTSRGTPASAPRVYTAVSTP